MDRPGAPSPLTEFRAAVRSRRCSRPHSFSRPRFGGVPLLVAFLSAISLACDTPTGPSKSALVMDWHTELPPQPNFQVLWGGGPADVFAAGNSGAVVHYDGTGWSPMETGTIMRGVR